MSTNSLELINAISILFLEMMSTGEMPSKRTAATAAECLDKVLSTTKAAPQKKAALDSNNPVASEYIDRPPGLCIKVFGSGAREGQPCPNKAVEDGCCGIHKPRVKKGDTVKVAAQASEKKVTAKFSFSAKKTEEEPSFEPMIDNNDQVPTFSGGKGPGAFKPQAVASSSSNTGAKALNFTSKNFAAGLTKKKPNFFSRQFQEHSFIFTTDELCKNLIFQDFSEGRFCIAMVHPDHAVNQTPAPLPDSFTEEYMVGLNLNEVQSMWCLQNGILLPENDQGEE